MLLYNSDTSVKISTQNAKTRMEKKTLEQKTPNGYINRYLAEEI